MHPAPVLPISTIDNSNNAPHLTLSGPTPNTNMQSINKSSTSFSLRTFCRRFMPVEVYPLLVPVGFACSLGAVIGYRTLSGAPDVHVFGARPRYETGAHRGDPHFAGIHSKASRFDPHPELGQAESKFHSSYSSYSA